MPKVGVNTYFEKCMEKILLRGGTESFMISLERMDKSKFIHYATYALFGLDKKTSPVLNYGKITFRNSKINSTWVTFTYNEKQYLFSPYCMGIAEEESWYNSFLPETEFLISLDDFVYKIKKRSVATYNPEERCYLLTQWNNLDVPSQIQQTLLRARIFFDDANNIVQFVSFND